MPRQATPLVEPSSAEGAHLAVMLRMADDYASDAKHFLDTGDLVRAFGAINYAHAWIDAGVKIGWLDGPGTTFFSRYLNRSIAIQQGEDGCFGVLR